VLTFCTLPILFSDTPSESAMFCREKQHGRSQLTLSTAPWLSPRTRKEFITVSQTRSTGLRQQSLQGFRHCSGGTE